MGLVRIRPHSSHCGGIANQPSHSVDSSGWQAKNAASIEFWIPWRKTHRPMVIVWLRSYWLRKSTTCIHDQRIRKNSCVCYVVTGTFSSWETYILYMYKFEAAQSFGPVGQACVEHQNYVALSLSRGTHILHAIECTQKISHRIFHPQKNHHGILHPQENHHGILSSKAFLTMEYVIHEAVDALAWGSSLCRVIVKPPVGHWRAWVVSKWAPQLHVEGKLAISQP